MVTDANGVGDIANKASDCGAVLAADGYRVQSDRIRKVNIRLHRGLADSGHMELHAEVPQFDDEVRIKDELAVCVGR